ncbi:MAG: ABC transporter ATP-binding protein [Candidatus Bipolaricaulia bacterium]
MSDPIVELREVRKRFNGTPVLNGVNLDIDRGETVVVIGRSGCGKTVLLKHLIGLIRPDSGSIRIDGTELNGLDEAALNEVRLRMGMLFQEAALFDSLSVYGNVGFALHEHSDLNRDEIRARVRECLAAVGLGDMPDCSVDELSGGMKKRVGLARAIAQDPDVLLYDEPTSGVDPIMGGEINGLIRHLSEELNVTSVVVTHELSDALAVADRIALLEDGVNVAEGLASEFETMDDPAIRNFFVPR